MTRPQPQSQLDDKRREPRLPAEGEVRVLLHTDELRGVSENVSSAGILMVADEPVRVSVEFGAPGTGEVRSGRLVRIQKMDGGRSGLAIEFDPK